MESRYVVEDVANEPGMVTGCHTHVPTADRHECPQHPPSPTSTDCLSPPPVVSELWSAVALLAERPVEARLGGLHRLPDALQARPDLGHLPVQDPRVDGASDVAIEVCDGVARCGYGSPLGQVVPLVALVGQLRGEPLAILSAQVPAEVVRDPLDVVLPAPAGGCCSGLGNPAAAEIL